MKCEQPGYRSRKSIQIHEPGLLPGFLREKIEEFRFPAEKFSSPAERETALYYDRLYLDRSVYVVYYSPVNPSRIEAVARIIEKCNREDKLPIEYARVLSTTAHSLLNEKREIDGTLFPVDYYDSRLPVCEVGGLHVAEIDPANGITLKSRYRALEVVMIECGRQIIDRGYSSVFLASLGTQHMERLYRDKFFFNEVAAISWGGQTDWRVMWRLPFANPIKKIDYANKIELAAA